MFGYKGNRGIIGALAFGLTGLCYKIFGASSKLFGKILFAVFFKVIPSIVKSCIRAILG